MKLSLKLLSGYFLIVGLAAFFVMRIFVGEIKPSVRVTIEENMVDMANLLAEFAAPEMSAPDFDKGRFAQAIGSFSGRVVNARIWQHRKRSLDLRVYVTDARGIVIYDSNGTDLGKDYSAWRDVRLTLRGEYGARSTRTVPGDDTSAIYHVAAPIRSSAGRGPEIIGVVTVAKPISTVSPIIDAAEREILTKGAWLILASAVIGLWVSTRLQRSVGRLVAFAQGLAQGRSMERPKSSTRELQQLADAMAQLRGQLDGKLYVERYVQALTHELKSPLTALQAHAELLAEDAPGHGSAARVLEQTQRMRRLVDQMLVLARLEGGERLKLAACDWGLLLNDLLADYQSAAADAKLRLAFEAPATPAAVMAEPALLHLACSALIQNALDFSPPGQTIDCRLAYGQGQWTFSVRDHGPGLSPLARQKLFERYFSTPRPATGQRSSGLGLALTREIIHAHQGRIALDDAEPGCRASISLPQA